MEGTARFITDYRNINQKMVKNPYPLPRKGEKIHQLEGLQYAMALDLNMKYYTIDISPESGNLTNILTEFGKFRYNRVPMVICASDDIFQAKVDDLVGDIDGFKTYIDIILVLGKGSFKQHID